MFKRLLIAGIVATLCLGIWSVMLSAQIQEQSFSITPQVGGYIPSKTTGLKDGFSIGLGTGYNFTKYLGTEFTFNRLMTPWGVGDFANYGGYMYRMDGIFHLTPGKKIVPYLAVGAGGLTLSPEASYQSFTRFLVNYGGGIKVFLRDNIAIRADLRGIRTTDPTFHNMLVSSGVEFSFGGNKESVVKKSKEVAPPPPPPDTDNDGVIDSNDKCPNTPAGVKVNADGCPVDSDGDGVADYLDKCPNTPAGVKVNADGCPVDSDGDGVADYLDKCPNTPAGVKVNTDGCPVDSDGDGVADYLDKCADTPAGAKINASGCPVDSDEDGVFDYMDKCPDTAKDLKVTADGCPILMKKKLTQELKIQFDTGKAVVKPEFKANLQEFADFMTKYPQTIAEISGHTDNVGSAAANKRLSQKRADAVRDFIIKNFNISPDRLTAKGYGPTKPIASNKTKEGKAANRRIEAALDAVSEYYEKK